MSTQSSAFLMVALGIKRRARWRKNEHRAENQFAQLTTIHLRRISYVLFNIENYSLRFRSAQMDKNQVEKIELSHLEAAANDYLFTCEQQHDYQVKSVVLMRESVHFNFPHSERRCRARSKRAHRRRNLAPASALGLGDWITPGVNYTN